MRLPARSLGLHPTSRLFTSLRRPWPMTAAVATALTVAAAGVSAQVFHPPAGLHHTSWLVGRELPVAGIERIARSPDGYLWLGSTVGLIRFDGVRFTILDGATVPALASETLGLTAPLFVDRDGTLWITRPDGAVIWYREGRFTVASDTPAGAVIDEAAQDRQGHVWLRVDARLFAWRDRRLASPDLPANAPDTTVLSITPDPDSGIWLGTRSGGLWHVTRQAASQALPGGSVSSPTTTALIMTDRGLLVGGRGLRLLHRGQVSVVVAGLRCGCRATQSSDGSIWISASGFGVLRSLGDTIQRIGIEDGLSSAGASDIMSDVEGSVWVVTDRGLDRFRLAAFSTIGRREGLPFDTPLHVVASRAGPLWVMDYSDLVSWRLDGGLVRGRSGRVTATRLAGANPIVAAGASSSVWRFGLHSERVSLDDLGSSRVVAPDGLAWTGVRRGFVSRDGTLWMAWSPGGFGRVRDFRFHRVPLGLGADPARLTALAEDGRGRVWLAVEPGRLLMIEGDSVGARYDSSSGIPAAISRLALEGGDTLWAASPDGLARIIGGKATVVEVRGLQSALATTSTALIRSGGHLWLASEGGIGRVPLAALHAAANGSAPSPALEWFNELDGLAAGRTTRFNALPAAEAADGRLWFATPAGLVVVDPANLPANPVAPQVLIEEIVVDGRPVEHGQAIPPRPDRLTIHFTASSLRIPERVRIEYRLDGADEDWVPATLTRTAEYSRLRPGQYTIHVRAWNEDGVASAAPATLGIQVLPAWDQRWWVRGLAALLAAGTIALLAAVAARARHRAAQALIRERYEGVLVERTRMARELHDTLLQGFTGITLQLHAIHQRLPHAPQEVAESLSRLMRVADASLREARDMVWDMRTPELDSQDLPAALDGLAQRACAGTSIALTVRTEGQTRRLPLELETTALRVVRECLANVIRHACASAVRITITYDPTTLTVRVADNGIGFDPAAPGMGPEHGHWGLTGLRERARRVNGTLDITSGAGIGTTVTLTLPTA